MIKISPINTQTSANTFKSKQITAELGSKMAEFIQRENKAFNKGYSDVMSKQYSKEILDEFRMAATMSGSPLCLRYLEGMAKAQEEIKLKDKK